MVKIILSRKGFDSGNGGYPSPILPGDKMISLPIPSPGDHISYSELNLKYQNKDYYDTYYDLMKELRPTIMRRNEGKILLRKDTKCHLDPDIYENVFDRKKGWRPLFGPDGSAQTHLEKNGLEIDDIFLFYGTFRKTVYDDGRLIFDPIFPKKHIIFGYLQVGEIETRPKTKVPKWMRYHPHCGYTMYVARKTLSLNPKLPGAGTFNYNKYSILTRKGRTKSVWELPFKNKISWHGEKWYKRYSKLSNGNYQFQSNDIGQEFVFEKNREVTRWAKKLISITGN